MAAVTTPQVDLRGLALPAVRTVGGYFASKNRYDTAWGDLLLAIFVPVGSRPGNRSFGSALHRVLFEPDVLQKQQMVRHIIDETAARWTPHVVIHETRVQVIDRCVQLWISFGLQGEESVDRRQILLSRERVIKTLSAQGLG
jgi:phage baseplate assembly protein W